MTAPTMSVEMRLRFIAAAQRGLAWRRERIMAGRLVVTVMAEMAGHGVDWHSLFDCDRHGHHPLDVTWVGPYDLESAVEQSGSRVGDVGESA